MDITFKEKIKWLSNHLGYEVKETEIHSHGQFKQEVEQDFNKLYKL